MGILWGFCEVGERLGFLGVVVVVVVVRNLRR